ncbi:MAG: sensor histidine kinase [Gemmatimonadaceae bacterium]
MPARPGQLSPSRVSLVVFVAGMVVLLAAVLAYEAHHAAQSQRRTAERALREYASMAGTEFHDRFHDQWTAEARRALGAATSGLALSPFDPLVSLAVLRSSAAEVLPCENGEPDSGRRYARIDLRSNTVVVEPATMSVGERDLLARAVRKAAQRLPSPEEPYLLTRLAAERTAPFVLVGVRFVRLGAPIGLYAFTVCSSALSRQLPAQVLGGAPLLPSSIAGAADNLALLSLWLRDGSGPLAQWGADDASPYRADVSLEEPGYTATVALRAAAVGSVAVGTIEPSRVPLLIGLLALTVALGAVALVQLRKEHDLAQMRADFTSSVSHELRTPLTQIMLYGETLLLERARTPEDRRVAAETIVQEAGRLMQMVENVLAFGRLRRASTVPDLTEVPVRQVVSDASSILQPLSAAAGRYVEQDCDDVVALADRAMLRQVLVNLLDNAIKYGMHGQGIRIDATALGRRIRISVSDQGPGVPAPERERVWMPYVRLAHPHGRGGTGLGLAIVRELVGLMRGRVWVEDAVTRGARFVVELEAAPVPVRAEAPVALTPR